MGFGGIPGAAFPNPTCVLVPPFLFANRNQFICVINGPGQICRQSKNLPRELIEQPKIRYSEELAGIRVFRSVGTPCLQMVAVRVVNVELIEDPTTTSLGGGLNLDCQPHRDAISF
jgi:hypothetical protein